MTTSYTSLLGLALPVTGELQGTWGDVVNQQITELLDAAVAGTTTLSVDADVTLSTTTGAANQSRQAILLWTATGTVTRNITAPAQSKAYIVINKTGGTQSIVIRGAGPTTGVTVPANTQVLVVWNGSDFVQIASSGNVVGPASSTDNAIARFDGTTGKLIQNSGPTIDDDGNMVISSNSSTDALRITQTGTGNALLVEDSANPDSTPFVINQDGQVIVGATTAQSNVYDVQSITSDGASFLAQRWAANSGGGFIRFDKSRSATVGSYSIVLDGDNIGTVEFRGDDGASLIRNASIISQIDGAPGTNSMPGRLLFNTTTSGSTTPVERMRIDSVGNVGIGGVAGNAAYKFLVTGTQPTSSNNTFVISAEGTIPSGSTNVAHIFRSSPSTQAASFTLSGLTHYYANQSTLGIGSAITTQYGFLAESSLTGATNNYGFFSNIASGTGRWNFYAAGTADNYFAGSVGIGGVPVAGTGLRVRKTITGSIFSNAIAVDGVVQSDVTDTARSFTSRTTTAAASFTLTNLTHFYAVPDTFGAGSSVTNQFGFFAETTLTGATNNYGFYSNIAAGTGRWNFYANGTADNYFGGRVGIGTNAPASLLHISDSFIQVDTTTNNQLIGTTFRNDATANRIVLRKSRGATVNTNTIVQNGDSIGAIVYRAADGTNYIDAAQISSVVDGTPGTNSMPTRLVFNTTASGASVTTTRMLIDSAGRIGIGTATPDNGSTLNLTKAITGATASYGILNNNVVQSDVTTSAHYYNAVGNTAAASFTLSTLVGYYYRQATIGLGSSVTNQFGFFVESDVTGATNNYGFYSNIASGTGRWNFFANGTANNAFAGSSSFGATSAPTALVTIAAGTATASTAPLKFTSGTNLTTPEAGVIEYDGTVMTATSNTDFKRGTIPITNYTSGIGTSGITATTDYAIFPSANDTITLPVGTYLVRMAVRIAVAGSTVNQPCNLNIRGGGTAVGSFSWRGTGSILDAGAANSFVVAATALGTVITVTATSSANPRQYIFIGQGILKVTTAGTIIPAYQFPGTLTSGTTTLVADNYMTIQQLDSQSAAAFGPAGTGWG